MPGPSTKFSTAEACLEDVDDIAAVDGAGDVADMDDLDERECLRCGSMLPEYDEGLCPTCGTEFGRATIAMPALPKPSRRPKPKGPADAASAPAPVAAAPEPAKSRGLLVAVMIILILMIVAGLAAVAYVATLS